MSSSNAIDLAILARARTGIAWQIHDGWYPFAPPATPGQPIVVNIPLPYANFLSSFGDDDQPRLSGRTHQREKFFRLFHVGISREQVVSAIEQTRNNLEGYRLVINGKPIGLIRVDSSPLIFRDDGAVRQDGKPIFSGLDNYTVRSAIHRS